MRAGRSRVGLATTAGTMLRRLAVSRVAPMLGILRGSEERRLRLFQSHNIATVLDVGANSGQYGSHLRSLGYRGAIISFEPLESAFQELQKTAERDLLWRTHNWGLGASPVEAKINVAENSWSSSLRSVNARHLAAAPGARIVGTESVNIRTLDDTFDSLGVDGPVLLKVDTQGWELEVLRGARRSLTKINTIQLEMSLAPLYDNEPTFSVLHAYLESNSYRLVGLEPGIADSDGELLQVDGIYCRL